MTVVSPRINFIHHVTLEMPRGRETEARQFYTGRVGLTEIEIPASLRDHEGSSVWFAVDAIQQLHLGPVEAFVPPHRAHVAFQVEDLATLRNELQNAGVRLQIAKPEPGWQRCYVFDPFGNKLELRQPFPAGKDMPPW